ncbi:glycoside hydrolase family 55 protein [Halobacillus locisalis]|nr:glycoside hydrolase family 55 protein [Halobacillus locisalis]
MGLTGIGVCLIVVLGWMIFFGESPDHVLRVEDFGAVGNDGKDDSEAIQRAIDASAEQKRGPVVMTTHQKYTIQKGIVLKEGVEIQFGHQSEWLIEGDFRVLKVEKNARIEGGLLMVQTDGFSSEVIYLDGEEQFWTWDQTGIEDVKVINTSGSNQGTGVLFHADQSDEFISFVDVEGVTVTGFHTGLKLQADPPEGEEYNFVNGNRFVNLTLEDCVRCINLQSGVSVPNEVSGNQFINIQIQLTDDIESAITITGSDNQIEAMVWDYESFPSSESMIRFDENSQRNSFMSNLPPDLVEDYGATNQSTSPLY